MSENLEATVRAEVRAWLEANWDPCLSLLEWRNMLAESGWGMPVWPREWWGRGLPPGMTPVVEDEFARINAVGVAKSGVRLLVAATILEHGTEAHKERFLKRILTGEDTWCQLFTSQVAALIWLALPREPSLRGTNGPSTAKRFGQRVHTMRTGAYCSHVPTGTKPNTKA